MSRVYQRDGAVFWPADPEALAVHDRLPTGTYAANLDARRGFYLERVKDFELPARLYGNVNAQASRILSTFRGRPSGTGVLLSGKSGAGKTMLTKRISQLAMQDDVITVLVNQPFCGEDFNVFLAGIAQPAIVLFDEFEKIYDREAQQKLLTVFDGTYQSKKLFLLTCNDRYRVDTHMLNRPGRLYYALEFGGLTKDFITEYCEDVLEDKNGLRGVLNAAGFFSEFSFDMLKALVEEMNRYGETATQAMEMLNMRPQNDMEGSYTVTALRDGRKLLCDGQSHDEVSRSPMSLAGVELTFYGFDRGDVPEGGLAAPENYTVELGNLLSVSPADGVFVFATHRPDTTIRFQRKQFAAAKLDYEAF